MEFEQAFKVVFEKWPNKIDISDITHHQNGGATIPALTKIHDSVETQCLHLGKEILAMEWSFFQFFHAQAKLLHKQNTLEISKLIINMQALEELYHANIN